MESAFEIGDRVKYVGRHKGWVEVRMLGKTGTVVDATNPISIQVQWDDVDKRNPRGVYPENIELLNSSGQALKTDNPKDALGSARLPVELWPGAATAYGCLGILNGKLQYGQGNYDNTPVRASIYVAAAIRHLLDWYYGNDTDPKDGLHNFCGALANPAILVSAMHNGTLVDDRPSQGSAYRSAREAMEPHVARLMEMHKDKNPFHYTNNNVSKKETTVD